MSQISNEIRLEAVQRVAEDGMSISASARLAGVHKSMLQEWVMQYREHGAEGVIKQDRKAEKIYWRIQNRSGRICAYEPSLGRSRIGALWPVHKVAVSEMGAYMLRGRASGASGRAPGTGFKNGKEWWAKKETAGSDKRGSHSGSAASSDGE